MAPRSSTSMDSRRARLQQLAAEWGVATLPRVTPPTPAPQPRTQHDDLHAEELLKRRRLAMPPDKQSQGGIKRAFSSSKKTWEHKEVFDALNAHVANGGAPGVADALVAKLLSAGGDPNVSNLKSKTNLITRRRSVEPVERSRILQKAIENRQADMVAVLAQHADHFTLDAALSFALRSGDLVMVHLLLARGANVSQTQDAQDAFRQLCIMGGYADLVGLVLQSESRPPPNWLSMCMVDAARKGCLQTVLRLSRSYADGEYNKGEAIKVAVAQGKIEIVLAILTGSKPPTLGGQGVLESFAQLLEHPTIGPNEKMALTEALLCAGASGDPVSCALSQACATEFYDMVRLLVSYGASVEYHNASIVRNAISRGQTYLVQLLLGNATTLSPIYASECVECIPKAILPEDRHAMLSVLLRKGASGTPLHEALIDVAQARDLQSAELLLNPHFPGAQPIATTLSRRNSAPGKVYARHETASVDHKQGLALSIAVTSGDLPMVKQLLTGKPMPQTLDDLFPLVLGLPAATRYRMVEAFLAAGVSRPSISAALEHAIEDQPPRRDENLIGILLQHNADVNFNDGAGILSAITVRDLHLLEVLLRSKPSPQTLASAMTRAMTHVNDRTARYKMVQLLIGAGAGRGGNEVSEALAQVLPVQPVDTQLVTLLLEQGQADPNFDGGSPVAMAVNDPDPSLLQLILQHGRPNPDVLYRALDTLCGMPTNPSKATKVDAILHQTHNTEMLNAVLFKEVETLLKTPSNQHNLAVLSSFLCAGADINAHKALAFCRAIRAANHHIVDLLFTAKPSPASLAAALPQSLNIGDPMDRLNFTQKLIAAGAPPTKTNNALVYAIETHPNDHPLLILLASHADARSGEALVAAIKFASADVFRLVLDNSRFPYAAATLSGVFQEALKVRDGAKRVVICSALLKRGVTGPAVSDALLTAASDGDLALGAVLLDHGASVEHRDGQAIVGACRAGSAAVLGMLLRGRGGVKKATLAKGFQAATQVGDLATRAEVFRLLLEKGVDGEVVDAELVSAAKFGRQGEALVRLLLGFGASVDYNAGEAIWNATCGAIMGSLKLLLGVERVGERQRKPYQETLLRSLNASKKLGRDPRYQVISWLFEVGLAPCEEINIALNRAVKAEPDPRLVQLLLEHGASPLVNGCATLTDAAQLLQVEILGLLLGIDVPKQDVSWAFQQAFTPQTASTWLSEQGFSVAKMLLEKGAEGESLALALSVAIDAYGSETDTIARKFATVLLQSKADVNYEDGLVVQKAARKADSELIQLVLQQNPNKCSVSMAFPYLFDPDLSEADTLQLMGLFLDYHHKEERLDVSFSHPQFEPVLFRAIRKFPRSLKMVQTLLDACFYHDPTTQLQVMEDADEAEQVSLLFWALFQPQKRVSSPIIELLIKRGAKVNFETRLTKSTPLMLAVHHRRYDLVRALILAGAEVDVADATKNTPLTAAAAIGGDVGISMMTLILAADPSPNDGSLHNAARDLNVDAMELLVKYGHDIDFPSRLHGGRSALGELCLNASRAGPLTAAQEKQMERAMKFLIGEKTDLTIKAEGKSVLLLALNSDDPIPTTRALLKVGLWRQVNEPHHHFTDGTHTYSATQYISRVLECEEDTRPQLLELLTAYRATDVYYANDGAQPPDAVNLPPELLRAERERRAQAERLAKDTDAHNLELARAREVALVRNQLYIERAEIEDARTRRRHEEELAVARARKELEAEAFKAELRHSRAAREAALAHEQRLTEARLTNARLVADAQMELEGDKHRKMITWDADRARQREAEAKALSGVRVREREAMERLDAAADARLVKRMAEQKKLIESQATLAALAGGPGGPGGRQIGYITDELD